jgi:kanamycin nucleotidyltransferase
MHAFGPQLLPRTQRIAIAHEIAERVKERFPLEVFAIGLYGSLAREEDGSYSDIELFGVLRTDHYKHREEPIISNATNLHQNQSENRKSSQLTRSFTLSSML